MRASALILLVAFAGLQSVALTDCPCGALCETKNACPDEKRHASPDDCCSRHRMADDQDPGACFHLEPQSDVDSTVMGGVEAPVSCLAPADVPPDAFPTCALTAPPFASPGRPPPERRRPLFLVHSALRI